jgi:hypothetical protein
MAQTLLDSSTGETLTLSAGPVQGGQRLMRLRIIPPDGQGAETLLTPCALRWLRDRLDEVDEILP